LSALRQLLERVRKEGPLKVGEPCGPRQQGMGVAFGDGLEEEMDGAIHKLEDGRYGICEDCDTEIPLKRLRIMPFTTCRTVFASPSATIA
jgi:DnaK suppressor protein